ncbi:acyl-ACP--UDP-N-acetylglucosamine O-acyltransferase [Gilvimarinus algae]|uniref:Acyl-[acyl-carrier-protein]--UDP-N-acetylglucosamine O-acyltransferase n=1 Tax=Gilvimarinus algae TaxID=3058037 RepID=A0ABT8TE97_9GAMM|nr:acyl-ACP--UDP-N-acetylglucosamine O-acyltransferase [Gilvimarinus sp. SDUM040014]MDO3382251.1 acyl-ACP--UDP-N-acetylglucosamine O-acyltransferase [Gilvimarinus sp. SDUM040014]
MGARPLIDPQAIVHPDAKVADDVSIGPWTTIGPDVEIGPGCVIASHVVIKGPTVIGANNQIYQFSSVGEDTPDLKYKGEPTRLVIGDNNIIREGVTIHRGTVQDRSETTIGSHNLIMAYVHIGHDSVLGDHCILVNNAALAGHVVIGDWAILSGFTLVHQFCSIGAHSFTGMGSAVGKDVPAFVMVNGAPAAAKSINSEGLRRRGYTKDQVAAINRAFKIIYRRGLTVDEALAQLAVLAEEQPVVNLMIDSLKSSKRGIVR